MHLLHKILPVQSLHNYKNTPITRFFSSTAAGTDIQNQIPTNNFHKSYTDSRSTLSTLTPSVEQRNSFQQIHKNSSNSTFCMHDLPETISIPYQIVFRPYLLHSTKICRSFSNDFLLPLAQKKNLVSLHLVPVQTPKIQFLNFLSLQKNLSFLVRTPHSPHNIDLIQFL